MARPTPAMYNTVDVAIHSREWMPPSRKMQGFSATFPLGLVISRTLASTFSEFILISAGDPWCHVNVVSVSFIKFMIHWRIHSHCRHNIMLAMLAFARAHSVPGFRHKMQQIWSNLITNLCKSMLSRDLQWPALPGSADLTQSHQIWVLLCKNINISLPFAVHLRWDIWITSSQIFKASPVLKALT